MAQNKSRISLRGTSSNLATGSYGKKFSQIGNFVHHLSTGPSHVALASATSQGFISRTFSNKYFDFSFTDLSSQTHYGWIYGSETGGYSDLTYNLISYGYDTTPNVQIGAGYEGAPTPEPSTAVMTAMAALILGAAGVRKRKGCPTSE
jgi:hypothetical protein